MSNLQDTFDNLFREAGDGGAVETLDKAIREMTTNLADPMAIAGAEALANMFAKMAAVTASSTGGLLKVIGAMTTKPSESFDVETLTASIMSQSVVDPNFVMPKEVKLLEEIAAAQKKVTETYSVRGYKIAADEVAELQQELENLQATYIPFQNEEFNSLGGMLDDPSGRFNMTADAQVDTEIPMALDGQSADDAAAQLALEAKQAEVDRIKGIEAEFTEWKAEKGVTELDLMKEGYLLQEEAYQAHMDEMFRIDEVNREVKKDLDDTSFLSAAAGNKSHEKFMEKAKKGEIKLEELTGKQKLKIGIGVASDILGHAAKNSETAFKLQKGLKMAEAIQNTYSAAMGAYSSLAPIPFVGPALGIAAAAAATMAGAANVKAIAATKFSKSGAGGSVSKPSMGGGGGGGVSAGSAAEMAPIQEASNDSDSVIAERVVNVTVDGTIDPSGARRIIEAINEATEDGLEINALVGT